MTAPTSPWVRRAQSNMLPAVDRSGAIYQVEEREARAAARITAERLDHPFKPGCCHWIAAVHPRYFSDREIGR